MPSLFLPQQVSATTEVDYLVVTERWLLCHMCSWELWKLASQAWFVVTCPRLADLLQAPAVDGDGAVTLAVHGCLETAG